MMSTDAFYARLPNGVLTACEEHLPEEGAAIPKVALVLAHGAGSTMTSEFMQTFAQGMAKRGVPTTVFNFSYADEGRRLPDRVEKLQGEFEDVVEEVQRRHGKGSKVFMGGKSMGGRVGTLAVAEGFKCAGLVLLGYPLHPADKAENLRHDHFPKIKIPALFVSGTKDRLAKQDLLRQSVKKIKGTTTLRWIKDGDHSLETGRGRGGHKSWDESLDIIQQFIKRHGK